MTRYTVVWLAEAQNELAELWLTAKNRREISRATDSIDIQLALDPENKGETAGDYRLLQCHPLTVVFRVREPDRIVEVGSVFTDSEV